MNKLWNVLPNSGRGDCLLHAMFPGEDPTQLRRALASDVRSELSTGRSRGVFARNTVFLGSPSASEGNLLLLRQQLDRLLLVDSSGAAASLDQIDARAFAFKYRLSSVNIYAFEDPAFDLILPTGRPGPSVDILFTSGACHFERLESASVRPSFLSTSLLLSPHLADCLLF